MLGPGAGRGHRAVGARHRTVRGGADVGRCRPTAHVPSCHRARTTTAVDTVVAQNPAEGTQVDPGTTVLAEINVGPATTEIPDDLVGRDLDRVLDELDDAGFVNVSAVPVTDPPADADAEEVLAVEPGEGEPAALEQDIVVRYAGSAGQQSTEPPDEETDESSARATSRRPPTSRPPTTRGRTRTTRGPTRTTRVRTRTTRGPTSRRPRSPRTTRPPRSRPRSRPRVPASRRPATVPVDPPHRLTPTEPEAGGSRRVASARGRRCRRAVPRETHRAAGRGPLVRSRPGRPASPP